MCSYNTPLSVFLYYCFVHEKILENDVQILPPMDFYDNLKLSFFKVVEFLCFCFFTAFFIYMKVECELRRDNDRVVRELFHDLEKAMPTITQPI